MTETIIEFYAYFIGALGIMFLTLWAWKKFCDAAEDERLDRMRREADANRGLDPWEEKQREKRREYYAEIKANQKETTKCP